MHKNRILTLMVLLSILAVMIPSPVSHAQITEPVINIIGSTIRDDKEFFELSMKITPGSEGFFSVGMALEYDSSIITPVGWDGTVIDMTDRTDWQNVAAVPAVSPTEISGKTALAYIDIEANKGYLYISSETALPVSALPDEGKILTIRFKYAGNDDNEIAANKQKIIDEFENGTIISLADDETAANSPVGQMVLYRACEDAETEYYYTTEEETEGITTLKKLTSAPEFVLIQDADSVNTGGGSDASNFAALVFFDWDESTLLGSMVVDGSMTAEEITEQTNSFAKTLMPPNMEWSEEKASEITTYDPKYPLTSHNGYTFGKWIEYTSEDFTIYGNAINPTTSDSVVVIDEPANPDYSKISGGIVLKAAYIANTTMDSYTTTEQKAYTVSNDTAPDAGYFGRFGTSSNYSLKFKVTRVNGDSNPVFRTRTTALRVVYTIGSAQVYSLINMDNVDEQIVEVAAPADADNVKAAVIDIGGMSNWASGSAARSSEITVYSQKQSENNLGYIIYGTVNYINQQVDEEGATTFVATIFTNANLDVSKGNVANATATTAVALRSQAVTNIRQGQQQKLADNGTAYLSWQEMAASVKYGDYTHAYP